MPEQELEVGMWVTDTFGNNIAKILRLETTKEFRQNAEVEVFDPVNPRIIIVDIRTMRPLRAPGEFKVGDEVEVAASFDGRALGRRFIATEPHVSDDGVSCDGWHGDSAPYDSWWGNSSLRLITPVEARGEQKGSSCESQSANSAEGSLSERASRTTPDGATKAAHGATQGSAQKNSENAKDKKAIEPSYFPPDLVEDEEPAGAKYFRLQREAEAAAMKDAASEALRMIIDDKIVAMLTENARIFCDSKSLPHETRAERIAKHFGGTGEPSVNRRNGTIGGRQG